MAHLKPLPDDIDLVVMPECRTPEGDALMTQFIAEQRRKPGYAAAVKRLNRTVARMVAAANGAKRKSKQVA